MMQSAGIKEDVKTAMRPPIVVVMGHVDHGKTTILDWYRKTKVAAGEAGGITQHIGAYEVSHQGKTITFIDTPGHEAFSKMRSRGARVADCAILVVAADEGVKPQTKEAIAIIKENNLPFIVVLNKIDKPDANQERVKQELAKENILLESYGGQVPVVAMSAKAGTNMDALLEMILLVAELEELAVNPEKPGEGVVIEVDCDPRRGITATLLLRDGHLTKGDFALIGREVETIKILEDFQGRAIAQAESSSPVVVAGLSGTPVMGDSFRVFPTKEDAARAIGDLSPSILSPAEANPVRELTRNIEPRARVEPPDRTASPGVLALSHGVKTDRPVFNMIVKADVAGSREALEDALAKTSSEKVEVRMLKSEIGDVNESDVKMAQATRLVTIVAFRVRVDPVVRELAERSNIHIVQGEVIYELLDAVREKIIDVLPAEVQKAILGRIKILKAFKREGARQIIGGRVEQGFAKKGARCDVQRNAAITGTGTILQLQREKQDVEEVKEGYECGILVEAKVVIQEGDVVEVFEEKVIKATL